MPVFELRFARTADQAMQKVSIEAPTVREALMLIPRQQSAGPGQLWCDSTLLFTIDRVESGQDVLWIITASEGGDDGGIS